jgi:hypothetical protein
LALSMQCEQARTHIASRESRDSVKLKSALQHRLRKLESMNASITSRLDHILSERRSNSGIAFELFERMDSVCAAIFAGDRFKSVLGWGTAHEQTVRFMPHLRPAVFNHTDDELSAIHIQNGDRTFQEPHQHSTSMMMRVSASSDEIRKSGSGGQQGGGGLLLAEYAAAGRNGTASLPQLQARRAKASSFELPPEPTLHSRQGRALQSVGQRSRGSSRSATTAGGGMMPLRNKSSTALRAASEMRRR